jgi:hypothetical protein
MLRLETFNREAIVRREHFVAVFFDLEKAYDTHGVTASFAICIVPT